MPHISDIAHNISFNLAKAWTSVWGASVYKGITGNKIAHESPGVALR